MSLCINDTYNLKRTRAQRPGRKMGVAYVVFLGGMFSDRTHVQTSAASRPPYLTVLIYIRTGRNGRGGKESKAGFLVHWEKGFEFIFIWRSGRSLPST